MLCVLACLLDHACVFVPCVCMCLLTLCLCGCICFCVVGVVVGGDVVFVAGASAGAVASAPVFLDYWAESQPVSTVRNALTASLLPQLPVAVTATVVITVAVTIVVTTAVTITLSIVVTTSLHTSFPLP